MIPADVRILTCKDLFIAQSALTGESLPIEKVSELSEEEKKSQDLIERNNLAFMGTDVISGTATALVVSTGSYTLFGKMAHQVLHEKPLVSDFQRGIKKVSYLLIQFMLAMVPIVLLINGFTKGDWLQASLFALSVAVGLTPEMLPMIVTATLAKGSLFLSKKKVIVKNLESIQSFGAMNVLCTDKTGTLTQDKIVLERYLDLSQREISKVLELGYLNSFHQTGLKNLLDVAILAHEEEVQQLIDLQHDYEKVDEVPFDFVRKRMSVIVCEKGEKNLLICKGASSQILKVSSHIIDKDGILELNEAQRKRVNELLDMLSRQGLRVVAVAYREFELSQSVFSVKDEEDLTIAGFIAFLDPPKESTAPALRALHASGVEVKILTGDNELVTKTICRQVNLLVKGVLLGTEIDEMSDVELQEWVDKTNVFARLTPFHKQRIVKALQDKGHVVGFMGDGINDAPALKSADIGISVDSAVDIAKESADLILLEKSLMVLEDGILEGRKTFSNMMKYIRMTASSNFGNVLSVMVASVFLPFLPMLPIQLLTQNLLYDISQTAIPFDSVDKEDIMRPQTWNPKSLARFMVFFGPLSSIFDIATYLILCSYLKSIAFKNLNDKLLCVRNPNGTGASKS
ncbi:UNVERIFIED_CONTAM: hypothetical protein PYX00_010951 [Menopon gallinae]|uniref:P-type Ca(2+) transporter n=1 Tax=Menopon gallinae TaxID=328185 RepID=A0AAW2H6P1_9NEOP